MIDLSTGTGKVGWNIFIIQEYVSHKRLECNRKKVVGKPYEGELHVRFYVAGDGDQDMVRLLVSLPKISGAIP